MANQEVYAPCSCGSGKKYKFCCLQEDREVRDVARGVAPDGTFLPAGRTKVPAVLSKNLYTLEVFLTGGPIPEKFEGKTISRTIEILGHETLEDLHYVIFNAFNREEEHLWEFQISGRQYGPGDLADTRVASAEDATLDSLRLTTETLFSYIFDFGDGWEHEIDVVKIEETDKKLAEPRIVKKTGKAPRQHADW